MTIPKRTPVGELRPSQLLYTFGVGSIVDLPHISAMIMGIEDWNVSQSKAIQEDRLLEQVQRRLGPQVSALRSPPMRQEAELGLMPAFDDHDLVGVPVAPFPRWMRCPGCNLLAPLSTHLFRLRAVPGRPDLAKLVHENCNHLKEPTVLPARFLFTCAAGHLDDFPWSWFVHRGPTSCHGALELRELGVSGEAADVEVSCRDCDIPARRMAEAFGEDAPRVLPACRGRRPQLRDFEQEPCTASVDTILLGATNLWFPITLSALYVPPAAESKLDEIVEQRWNDLFANVTDPVILSFLEKQGQLAVVPGDLRPMLWEAIERRRKGASTGDKPRDLKTPEWEVLSAPDPRRNAPDFELRQVGVPGAFSKQIERVVLAERLREVTALTGFTRVASPRDLAEDETGRPGQRGLISRHPPAFVPASEVRGEGIFLQFDEQELAGWCDRQSDHQRAFEKAHTAWRRRRRIEPPEGHFPGLRFVLIHSFAHALMRELAVECGYSMASLRERIYARDTDQGAAMAGVLIYTAAPDAEGTLGGLVSLGRPDELERHITRALAQVALCSSDPLCADHLPDEDGSTLHGACCHACLFVPETSCERGNRYLDRSVLVATARGSNFGFFV